MPLNREMGEPLSHEVAEQTIAIFSELTELLANGIQSGKAHIKVFWNGNAALELPMTPELTKFDPGTVQQAYQDIVNVLTQVLNGKSQEVIELAEREGPEAAAVTKKKIEDVENKGLINYLKPRWRFLVNTEGTVFDSVRAHVRMTPLKPGFGPPIVSAEIRMGFRDNLTGNPNNMVAFEADAFTLELIIGALSGVRDMIKQTEGDISLAKDKDRPPIPDIKG